MRVLVTGGSGFVGRHLIRQLVHDGHEVLALARSTAAAQAVHQAGAQAVSGDLADLASTATGAPPQWAGVLRTGLHAVVHAAAFMQFWGPDGLFVSRNLMPTKALYKLAVDAGVPRFVLLSAASVSSGSQRSATVNEGTDPGVPNIAYSRVKLRTEQELLASRHDQTTLIVLRPPYVWGQGMTVTLDAFVDSVNENRFAWIDGGKHLVDFIHVDNLAHAVSAALTQGDHGLVCYVTDGTPLPARQFFSQLVATRGVTIGKRSVPRPLATIVASIMEAVARARKSSTPPPLTHWVVTFMGRDRTYDITRARTALGYRPVVSLTEGLQEMAENHRARTGADTK